MEIYFLNGRKKKAFFIPVYGYFDFPAYHSLNCQLLHWRLSRFSCNSRRGCNQFSDRIQTGISGRASHGKTKESCQHNRHCKKRK